MASTHQLFLFLFISATILILSGSSRASDCKINAADPSKVAYTITVDTSGSGNFVKIQDAIDSIPSGNDQWIRIFVNSGTYVEKILVPEDKPCILLQGASSRSTRIFWQAHHMTNTSATFTSWAENLVAKDITFQNGYNRPVISANSDDRNRRQAVAAEIIGDKSAFYRCGFIGLQDTLWDVQGRHYFKECYIEGAVDFIFGNGQTIYEKCYLNVSAGNLRYSNDLPGFVTAQGRFSADEPTGFVFNMCALSGTGLVYLGRAYGPYSRVIFHNTAMSGIVVPEGWDAWNYKGQEDRFTYAEANCRGPGSITSNRVAWEKKLSRSELRALTSLSFIDQEGWLSKQP
ncbi:PREDICTED: probable pectinesterase 55 [Nelumbo nucifera]|uniref:Pectinesterase n=2 Tax=Nelumbo nucifera TaxID=4432 RepID=A0A822Z211_NELNU|nr:PREDICTED: probable pectinesterase 55 [Nelumbo nucifera]DAD37036.1 TPA_asm: hypothetical protein HUJ06_007677 [Nelumbo nucifera]